MLHKYWKKKKTNFIKNAKQKEKQTLCLKNLCNKSLSAFSNEMLDNNYVYFKGFQMVDIAFFNAYICPYISEVIES